MDGAKMYYFSTQGTTLSLSLPFEVVGTAAAAAAWAAALRPAMSKKDVIVFFCWLSEFSGDVSSAMEVMFPHS